MKNIKFYFVLSLMAVITACGGTANTDQTIKNTNVNATPEVQKLSLADPPQKLKDMMAARGEQDSAAPTLKIVEPAANSTVASSSVKVKLNISGDLKGYKPHMDMETKMGNHIHVILDN
ncbi:MAG: hypothetical protein ABIV48_00080, partial [Pyrinomonadaceae bacterium]